MMRKQKNRSGSVAFIVTAILFCIILGVMASGTLNLSRQAGEEGIAATRQAIERAAVLCYATEGFYPPGLEYLESHYGVQIDYSRYTVRYEVFSSNITPTIAVVPRKQVS